MTIRETRKMIDAEVEAADSLYNRLYRKYGMAKLNRKWIRAGVWEYRGKDGKWRTVKLRKRKPVKPDMRFASGIRDTAKPEIAAAGKPGSESRIAAMVEFYNNPANVEQSAFTVTDSEIAESLAGVLVAKIQNARYNVDAIEELDA